MEEISCYLEVMYNPDDFYWYAFQVYSFFFTPSANIFDSDQSKLFKWKLLDIKGALIVLYSLWRVI